MYRATTDTLAFTTGGTERVRLGTSEMVINEGSADYNFRVESNNNANMLFVDGGNDRVGIGTASPSSLLSVGTVPTHTPGAVFTASPSSFFSTTTLGGTTGNDQKIAIFGGADATNVSGLALYRYRKATGTNWTTDGFSLRQEVDGTANIYNYMNFAGGNVGIGTVDPGYELDIQSTGDSIVQTRTTTNSSGNDAYFRASLAGSNAGDAYIQFDIDSVGGYSIGIDNSDSDKLKFDYGGPAIPGGGTKLTITSAGNVGIGTDDPSYLLDISGDSRVRVTGTNAANFGGFEAENNAGVGSFLATGGNGRSDLLDNRGYVLSQSAGDGLVVCAEGADPIIFATSGFQTTNEAMRIDADGKVGIANTTPKYNLDVNAANNTLAASFGHQIANTAWTGIHFGYKEPANASYRKSALVFERIDNSSKMDGSSRSNNAGGAIHMLLANYGSSTASNLTQYSQDHEDGHVVGTWHTDGSYETIHAAEWTHGTTSTEANYQRQRLSLTETIYDTQYIDLDPPAYSNGNWYVLVGVRSGTADRNITFKVDLQQASWIFFEAAVGNSADATSRTHTISYSFDNVTYTQLQTASFSSTSSSPLRDTVFFNTTSQNNYTGQIYLRTTISGGTSSHNTLVGWTGFKIKSMGQGMSFNTNKTFRGASRYIGQFCTNAAQNTVIANADAGYVRFAAHMDEDMDTDIMEARTSGNFGVQFKKAGWVMLNYNQDIMTTGTTGYISSIVYRGTASQIDAHSGHSQVGEFLITNTSSQWDMMGGATLIKVAANDVIGIRYSAAAIAAMDSGSWSTYCFDWFEQKIL